MADVYVNALTTISTEPTTTDSIVCVNRNTNEGQIIDYGLLADVILDKLTSKTFSALTTTSKLVTGAINELDSDVTSLNNSLSNKVKYLTVAANSSATTPKGDFVLLVCARKSLSINAVYGIDTWEGVTLIAGTALTNVTITVSSTTITIQNSNSNARAFLVITV